MKNRVKLLLAMLLCLFVFACSDEDTNIPLPSPFSVSVQDGNGSIDAAGGTINMEIKAGTDGWWITIPENHGWCTASQLFGGGDKILPIKIAANNTGSERVVEITFYPTFDLPPVSIILTQHP